MLVWIQARDSTTLFSIPELIWKMKQQPQPHFVETILFLDFEEHRHCEVNFLIAVINFNMLFSFSGWITQCFRFFSIKIDICALVYKHTLFLIVAFLSGKAYHQAWYVSGSPFRRQCYAVVLDYLENSFQKVVLGECFSAPWPLAYRVPPPQSSILGPMLFNICVKLLGEVIQRFGQSCHQYTGERSHATADSREAVETEEVPGGRFGIDEA